MDKAFALILVIALIALAIMFKIDQRHSNEYDKAMAACIVWANNHVYPDGKKVADSVDPAAWCKAE